MPNTRIMIVGGSYMQLDVCVTRLAEPGECVTDPGGISYSPSGSIARCGTALSAFGAECIAVTKLGADLNGQKLYSFYKESGMNTSFVKVDREFQTGLYLNIREGNGSSRATKFPGANEQLTAENVSEAFVSSPAAVYLDLDADEAIIDRSARLAASRQIPVFLNLSPAKQIKAESLPPIDFAICDEGDLLTYTGERPGGTQETLRATFALWRKLRAKYLVIRQGERGAMVFDGKRCEVINPCVAEKGYEYSEDRELIFGAAFTAEFIRVRDVKFAAKYAVAAVATPIPARGKFPTDEAVRGTMKRNRY